MTIRDALTSQLAVAMQRRDRAVAAALRTTLGALDNAEAAPVRPHDPAIDPRVGSVHVAGATHGLGATEAARVLRSEAEQRAIVAGEHSGLLAHAERLARMCRLDEADGARRAAAALATALARDGSVGS